MASDSPRGRIDQFFSSKKKRKILSPPSKSGRLEKEARNRIEGSPSAKGSLESYLETSKTDHAPAKSLNSVSDQNARLVPIERSLILDTGISSKDDDEDPCRGLPQSPEASRVAQGLKSEVFSDIGSVGTHGIEKDNSQTENPVQISELKEFATGFLSLYCSELKSSVSLPSATKENAGKRHSSSSTSQLEEKSSKRRHCANDGNQSNIGDKSISSPKVFQSEEKSSKRRHCANDGNQSNIGDKSISSPKAIQSEVVNEIGDIDSNCLQKAIVSNHPFASQASLRKCTYTSAPCRAECETPGSFPTRLRDRETPPSTRGSSLFSPGEAFWNEAILVADELFVPCNGLSSRVAENSEPLKSDYGTYSSNDVKNGAPSSLLNCAVDGVKDTVSDFGTSSAGGSLGMHGKELDKEVSPLPVKHFDFTFEAKTSGKDIPLDANSCKPGNLTSKENPLASIKHTSLGNNIRMCIQPEDQMSEILDAHGTTFKCLRSKRSEDHLNQDNHKFASNTPDREYNKVAANHECKSNYTPASSSSIKDCLDLSNWLPPEICKIYNKKGISKLYPWQVDCLQVDGVLHNRNLVYSASTSAGKSFVAEILMLRRVLATGKIAVLVLPYVSICAEKAEHLEALLEPLDKHVRSFYGNQGGGTLPKDTSVAVCTIEKANCLINRSVIRVGVILELMLTKLRYAAGEGNVDSSSGESSGTSSGKFDPARGLQIVGMSATLPNVAAVAAWLQAALYETDFRPVPLEEYIKVGSTIYNKEMEVVRTLPKVAELGGKDPDHIVELCNEVVQEGHSVLIFCSSRKGCESTARHIAKYLKRFSVSPCAEQGEPFDVAFAIDSLRRSPAGLDPILEETLPCGVAYHHAGLTVEERETVETCYRKGLVRVLTATSTLAAGVNLPARRVIFRQPRIGRDFIDGTRYRQMAGRAGRTGIDTKGESVLICKPEETKKILAILNGSCPPLYSCLSEDRNGMTHAILEVVAGGIVQTASDIHRYVRCTLLNSTKPFDDVVKSAQDALRWLCHKKFLEWSEETKLYTSTPLVIVLDDLMRAREGFVLASDLHLVYLVTPINVDVEPDWELYYERFMQLSSLDQSVGNRVGVQEPFLMRMAHGSPPRASHRSKSKDNAKGFQGKFDHRLGMSTLGILTDDQILRVCKRFYVALILSRLVQEIPVGEVCEGFKVARGMVQALQENAGRFASMVSVFCERLGWNDLESLVGKFQNRVSFGVRAEIVELTSIPYIKGSRARALYKAGLRTPQAIAEASIPEIAKALFESSSWSAHGSAQRKLQMGVAKKIKNGARKIVLDKAEEARVAAFSAFKSLGLDVPQIGHPLLCVATGSQKESAFSPGEESTSNNAVSRHSNHMLNEPSSEDRREITGLISETKEGNTKSEILVEKPVLLEEWANTLNNKPSITANCIGTNRSTSHPLTDVGDIRSQSNEHLVHVGQQQPKRKNICAGSIQISFEKGPVNVMSIPGGLESFLDLWDATKEFFFDIHFTKKSELNSIAPFEIHGIAICWENTPVYYLNIPKDIFRCCSQGNEHATGSKDVTPPKLQVEIAKKRWSRIGIIMGKKDVRKFTWNLKVQIQVLKNPAVAIHKFSNLHGGIKSLGLDLIDNSYFMFSPIHMRFAIDMCVVAWILAPDEERSSYPNLEKEVKRRLSSDAAASANRSGRWKDQTRRAAHNGCCRRVAQTRALFSVLWKLLESEELVEPFMMIEVRLVDNLLETAATFVHQVRAAFQLLLIKMANVLADMEIWGIGVDMEGCLRARHILGRKLKCLEREAYKLAGKTFSLSMPADIASVLYEHLKLQCQKAIKGNNTLAPTSIVWIYYCSRSPLLSIVLACMLIFGKCINIVLFPDAFNIEVLPNFYALLTLFAIDDAIVKNEHPIVPVIKEHRTLAKLLNSTLGSICSLARLSMRAQKYTLHGHWLQTSTATGRLSMEEPNLQDDWLLLTADYSQIELRLMAHFSKDHQLVKLLSSPQGDVFTMIAAKWSEKHESSVTLQERDQTKRLVYGILYGMGPSTLAEQLDCSPDEAAERIRNFKTSFPGVAAWLQEVVTSCYKKGTLASHPSFIDAEKVQILKGRSRILLQVHDELVLEADPSVVKEAGLLLRTCMENAVSLLVTGGKLHVAKTFQSKIKASVNIS
ncbi:Helicase and polymerase-containing protein TEBICHI [Sesamum angolense]|uniref:Helicase and polymerase-containing protein TEBICHI n=1 Tax=Sesamum angolense TaxID=2727404 RepID=A0AAE1W966_9LAMI|nr:Helicase and polymerase-containing protein TEBICHI [Sesamum angolense]